MLLSRPSSIVMLLVVAAGLLAGTGDVAAQRRGFDLDASYAVPIDDSPRRGPADALVTIVEFSDFACRYCNEAQATLAQLQRLYPGQLRLVFRQYPLDDEDGTLAAEATLAAAAQGKFWPMHDRLFAVRGRVDRVAVELIAAELGLDLVRLRADLDGGVHRAAVARDVAAGRSLGVTGTPTFFVNGRALSGNPQIAVLSRIVDEELARAAALVASGVPAAAVYDRIVAGGRPRADGDPDADHANIDLDSMTTYRIGLGLDGHALGPADAPVTIVEWSDFQCSFCARNWPTLLRLRQAYPDQIRLVFRHLPLGFHPAADLAAEAAVAAAAQGKFWPMHDRLIADQAHLGRADLEAHARAIGLELDAFRAALDDRRYREAVANDAATANALGINGTPTMFINGTPMVGALPFDRLKLVVDEKLAQARQLVAGGVAPADVYGVIMVAAETAERGDPSRLPRAGSIRALELGAVEREAAVVAACRGRDAARAGDLAGKLKGAHRDAARGQCAAFGVDLDP